MAKPQVRVEVAGLADLEKALAELPKSVAKAAVKRTLMKAAKPILDAMIARVPVDKGDLKASLVISTKTKKEVGRVAYASVMRGGGDKGAALAAMRTARRQNPASFSEVFIGPTGKEASRAHLSEFGTGPRPNSPDPYKGPMPATPFMRPAWDGQQMTAFNVIKDDLADNIAKAKARHLKRLAKKNV